MCTDINSSKDVELWIDMIARASWQETENAPVEMSASFLLTMGTDTSDIQGHECKYMNTSLQK